MTKKKHTQVQVSQEENALAQRALPRYHQIADTLRTTTEQPQAEAALAEINAMPEAAQVALLKLLSKEHNTDAANVLIALNELSPNKAVRKEARRSLIRLEGARIYPNWNPPLERASVFAIDTQSLRFLRGIVSDTFDAGEVNLMLCWQQGNGQVRLMGFLLEFWHDGVKDFFTEVSSKHHIEEHLTELEASIETKECTLAEGRSLIQEALDVNKRYGTTPHADYRRNLSLIKRMVLEAPDVGEDGGTSFIRHDMSPEEVVASFVEAQTSGRYGLAYDLLSGESPVRDGLSRQDWVKRREEWAQAARPANFQPVFLNEREQQKSGLWLPLPFSSKRSTTRKEIDTTWSLELAQTPLSEGLKELPTATAIYPETGRHWFWNNYVLVQEQDEWRIQDIIDETANARQLSIQELQKRIEELDRSIEEITKHHTPSDPDADELFAKMRRYSILITNYQDALIEKLPLDRSLYEVAAARMLLFKDYERSLVYTEEQLQRFPERRALVLGQIGTAQMQVAEEYEEIDANRADHFLQLAEVQLRASLDLEDHPIVRFALAELLVQKANDEDDDTEADALLDEAVDYLRHASTLATDQEQKIAIENRLAEIAVDRERYEEAIEYYQRLTESEPDDGETWYNLGETYRLAENFEEAEASYRHALELDPNILEIYPALGSLYVQNEEKEKALELMEEGLRRHPDSAEMRSYLAPILAQTGDYRRAEVLLNEAERMDPELPMLSINRLIVEAAKQMQKRPPVPEQKPEVSSKSGQRWNVKASRGKKRRKR